MFQLGSVGCRRESQERSKWNIPVPTPLSKVLEIQIMPPPLPTYRVSCLPLGAAVSVCLTKYQRHSNEGKARNCRFVRLQALKRARHCLLTSTLARRFQLRSRAFMPEIFRRVAALSALSFSHIAHFHTLQPGPLPSLCRICLFSKTVCLVSGLSSRQNFLSAAER